MNKIISTKDGIIFTKINNNEYTFTTTITNTNINLKKIINVNIFKHFFKYKQNLCDVIEYDVLNYKNGKILLIFKHFFEDIGFPQYYFYRDIIMEKNNNIINFIFNPILMSKNNKFFTEEIEESPISNFKITVEFKDIHNLNGLLYIEANNNFEIYNFIEKIIGVILTKIILILKYIIENYHILNNE